MTRDVAGRRDRSNRNTTVTKKKLIPGPNVQLKVFNWSKLPEAKAASSIWKDIDEVEVSVFTHNKRGGGGEVVREQTFSMSF